MLSAELGADPEILAFPVRNPNEALASRAQRLVQVSFRGKSPNLILTANSQDFANRKNGPLVGGNGTVLAAVEKIAKQISSKASSFSTTNEDALRAWAHADFEGATKLDPDFGPAWETWVGALAQQQNREQALAVANRALAQPTLKTPLVRARIELIAATLANQMGARHDALLRIAALTPDDPNALLAAAEGEDLARNFPAAIKLYQQTLVADPGFFPAMNGWGYAEGESGHLDTAKTILEEYGKQPAQAVNALDSLGEVHFMNGRFKEAAQYFEQAAASDGKFLNGSTLYKAAYARWLSNDLPAADANMQRFLQQKAQDGDVAIAWRNATWLYSTGRQKEALAKLDTAPADQKPTIDRQRAVWRGEVKPPNDLKFLKELVDTTVVAMDGLPRTIYAAALDKAGQQDAARQLLQRWPLPETAGDPLLQSLVYPQYLELRKRLNVH